MATSAPATSVEAPAEIFTVQLSANFAAILRGKAQEEGCSIPQLIADALADWCDIRDCYPELDSETVEYFRRAIEKSDKNPGHYVDAEQVFARLERKYQAQADAQAAAR